MSATRLASWSIFLSINDKKPDCVDSRALRFLTFVDVRREIPAFAGMTDIYSRVKGRHAREGGHLKR